MCFSRFFFWLDFCCFDCLKSYAFRLIAGARMTPQNNDEYDLFDEAIAVKTDRAKDMLMQILSEGARSPPEIRAMLECVIICGWRTVETAKASWA